MFGRSDSAAKLLAIDRSFAVIEYALDGRIIDANANYLRVVGYERHEILDQHHSIFLTPGMRDTAAYQAFWQSLNHGESRSAEFLRMGKGGREIWLQASYNPIIGVDGQPAKIIEVAIDNTERHRQEAERKQYERSLEAKTVDLEYLAANLEKARNEANAASRAKSRFLAGMSHELRTPLNGILGYAQLLRIEGGLTPQQSGRVEAMLRAGSHLLEMINSVLDLSQIEIENVELQNTQVDLRTLLQTCIDLVLPTAEAKHLKLTATMGPNVPALIVADRTRLRQVVLNLLGNAVKFTHQGSVEVQVLADSSRQIRFEVMDTGPGVPQSLRHRLFKAFDRLGGDAAQAEEGTGLGLALSARLAEVMNGTLGHRDNPVGGSVFWLEMPLVPVAAASKLPVNSDILDAQQETSEADCLQVLVVDDVAMNRDIAAAFLRSAGHKVILAGGGEEAVATAEENEFDVIMMDLRMPGMDGLEATRRIRALPGPHGQVPIVALTAQVFTEQLEQCRAAGMDDHLAKPFTRPALLDALARVSAKIRAPRPSAPDAAPVIAAAQLPILNQSAFELTLSLLEAGAVGLYLQSLNEKTEALLDLVRLPDWQQKTAPSADELAHALAGSAGMFGFERLVAVARSFENAVQTGSADTAPLRAALDVVLVATMAEIQARRDAARSRVDEPGGNVVSIKAASGRA
jgi:PAS domain S-box-containing protein